MRQIGTLADPGLARRFHYVLFAEHILSDLEEADGATIIWVHDDAAVPAARERLAAFVADPGAFAEAERAGQAAEARRNDDQGQWVRRVRQARHSVHGADGRGWITMVLLAGSLVVAGVSNLGSHLEPVRALFLTTHPAGAGLPELMSGQVWRLFTPILVHFGVMHLAFNGLNWWSWAGSVEVRKGAGFFSLLVLSAAALTNLGEHAWGLWTNPHGVRLVGGLSGVLFAVFGYAWAKGRYDPTDQLGVSDSTIQWMMAWLLLCMTGLLGPIANVAHVVGLVWGGVVAWLDIGWFQWRKRRP